VLFGSRAKGTARKESDVDLAVTGTADDRDVEALILDLDELPLPYKFDVKDLARIRHASLLSHMPASPCRSTNVAAGEPRVGGARFSV
jgi:predicted nucleotidyltransferase